MSGGVVYVGILDGDFYATDVGSAVESSAAMSGDKVFVGTDREGLKALDLATGQPV